MKKIQNKKKSDFDKIMWEGTITDKILSAICILILFGIFGFIICTFLNI